MMILAFMPALAFAGTETAAPQMSLKSQEEIQYENPEEDETVDWTSMQPDELRVYDELFNLVASGEAAEKWALDHKAVYPTKLTVTSVEELYAYYLNTYIDYDALYWEGNSFTVEYSYGAPETYKCIDIDGFYDFFLNGDPEGQIGFIFSSGTGEDQLFTYQNNKGLFFFDYDVQVGGKWYTLRKASSEVTVPIRDNEPGAGVYDSEGRGYTFYTGKKIEINLADVEIYPYILNVVSVEPAEGYDLTSIGYQELLVKFDNSKGYYDSDTIVTGYQIRPKMATGLKLKNTKKNTIKVSWKYTNKKNLKQISGFKVKVYDTKDNLILEKYVAKSKTSVTLKNKKLKKGKKYVVEVNPYKTIDDIDWTSDPVTKKITLKK